MKEVRNRKLILSNGRVFEGIGFGSDKEQIAELVFNTSMVGYQEILSDPSYCGQFVCMTYPLIGNYGVTDEDYESKQIKNAGFIVREYNDSPSNFRATSSLGDVMDEAGASGIAGIDTRELTRIIRNEGSMLAMITSMDKDVDEAIKEMNERGFEHNQVERVSTKKVWYSRTANPLFTVVAVDCGMKMNIVRKFTKFGCNVVVVPHTSTYEDVMNIIELEKPDGEKFRQIAGYLYNEETQEWELLSCWRVQALHRGLGGGCGFVEDFRRNVESKKNERRATFGPAFRWVGNEWKQATEFRFTRDANPNNEINCRLNPKLGYFSLATGGKIAPEPDFKPFDVKPLTPLPEAKEPDEKVMSIINAPKLERVEYTDDGANI